MLIWSFRETRWPHVMPVLFSQQKLKKMNLLFFSWTTCNLCRCVRMFYSFHNSWPPTNETACRHKHIRFRQLAHSYVLFARDWQTCPGCSWPAALSTGSWSLSQCFGALYPVQAEVERDKERINTLSLNWKAICMPSLNPRHWAITRPTAPTQTHVSNWLDSSPTMPSLKKRVRDLFRLTFELIDSDQIPPALGSIKKANELHPSRAFQDIISGLEDRLNQQETQVSLHIQPLCLHTLSDQILFYPSCPLVLLCLIYNLAFTLVLHRWLLNHLPWTWIEGGLSASAIKLRSRRFLCAIVELTNHGGVYQASKKLQFATNYTNLKASRWMYIIYPES